MRAVAGAEPATKVTGLADRDTAKMCADACASQHELNQRKRISQRTKHDQPLGVLDTVRVRLRVAQRLPLGAVGLGNLIISAVTDENGLASPFDNHLNWSESASKRSEEKGSPHFCPREWHRAQSQPWPGPGHRQRPTC